MYESIFTPEAQEEYEAGLLWYANRSKSAAEFFALSLEASLDEIEQRPKSYPRITSLDHEIHLKSYPYTLVYRIDEERKLVVITSVFHQSRDPQNKYK